VIIQEYCAQFHGYINQVTLSAVTLSYPVKWGEGWIREATKPVVQGLLHVLPS